MAIGEAGSITTSSPTENQPITVNLTEPLTDPVFALSSTSNGGDPFVLRITNQTFDTDGNTTAFTFIIEEWEYLDGAHGATETINWLAIEEGVHTLPDGRVIEAGTVSANHTNSAVSLSGGFAAPPVVLTSVMSENDAITVDSDPINITSSGFNVRLQEEEGQDGIHGNETVGWIAIQPGGDGSAGTAANVGGVDHTTGVFGLGATFTDSVVLAETQTINGPDTASVSIDSQSNTNVGVSIQEETSNDGETVHTTETVGIVAFEDGLIACFTDGTRIRTPNGECRIEHLRSGDMVRLYDDGAGRATKDAPVIRVFSRSLNSQDLAANPDLQPVRITAGALNGTLPARDLLVSRQHRMLVSSKIAKRMFGVTEVLIPAIKLTELPGIFVDEWVETVTYFHLLLDRHEVIYAEGLPSESFYTGDEALKALTPEARQEIRAIFPHLRDQHHRPQAARVIPPRKRQHQLIRRHIKNDKPVLEKTVI